MANRLGSVAVAGGGCSGNVNCGAVDEVDVAVVDSVFRLSTSIIPVMGDVVDDAEEADGGVVSKSLLIFSLNAVSHR